jgi:hypothetical protein
MIQRKRFAADELLKVGSAYEWPRPPGVGAAVILNSGGPQMLIVDLAGDRRVCCWPGGESSFDWRCLRPATSEA